MNGWDCLPSKTQQVFLVESASDGTSIPTSPPSTIHQYLNARNNTALQADCALTYAGQNIYLPTLFYQYLLQWHTLTIPDQDSPTGLSPPPSPSFTGPTNTQQKEIKIQVLIVMGQYRLSKDEAEDILEQRVHVLNVS